MKKIVLFILLIAVPAVAVTVVPVFSRNAYVNTTAEVISSSGGTACKKLTICNQSETATENAFVQNSSGVSRSTGIKLYPDASTAGTQSCVTIDAGSTRGKNESDTIDATAWYAVAETGVVEILMVCIP